MKYVIEATKTNVGIRKLPMTEDLFCCFQVIIKDRKKPRFEKMVDDYTGFLFSDKDVKCIGSTGLTTWSNDIMTFPDADSKHHAPLAATPTVVTWRNPE